MIEAITQESMSSHDTEEFRIEVNLFVDQCIDKGSATLLELTESMADEYGDNPSKLMVAIHVLSAFLFFQNPDLLEKYKEAFTASAIIDVMDTPGDKTKH